VVGQPANVAISCVGNASGCSNGQMISPARISPLIQRVTIDQYLLLVLSFPPDSMSEIFKHRLTSDIRTLLLRHRHSFF